MLGALAGDVEYRLRDVLQDAAKYMRHAKRAQLRTSDIDAALRAKNVEPLYGYFPATSGRSNATASMRAPSFRKTATPTGPVYYLEDDEIDFDEILHSGPILALGKGVGWGSHWLAIEGIQPAVPQNPSPAELGLVPATVPSESGAGAATGAAAAGGEAHTQTNGASVVPATLSGTAQGRKDQVVVRPLVKHVLSRELQLYFERLTSAITDPSTSADAPTFTTTGAPSDHPVTEDAMHDLPPASDSRLGSLVTIAQQSSGNLVRDAALASLRGDPGLHQLVPYLVQWVGEKIGLGTMDGVRLEHMMLVVHALLVNPHIFIEPYLHQLMPSVLSVLLTASLVSNGKSEVGTGYTVRAHAALLLCHISTHYGKSYPSLRPRIVATLLKALLAGTDPTPAAMEHTGGEALAASEASKTAPTASVSTKLGALLGLRCLGSAVVQTFLLGPSGVVGQHEQQNYNALYRLGSWVERLSATDAEAAAWLCREVRLALHDVAPISGSAPSEDEARERLVQHYGSFWTARFVSDPLARHALFHAVAAHTGSDAGAEEQDKPNEGQGEDQGEQQGDQSQQQGEKPKEDNKPHSPPAGPEDTIMAEADAPAAPPTLEQSGQSEQPEQPEQPTEQSVESTAPTPAPPKVDAQAPTEPAPPATQSLAAPSTDPSVDPTATNSTA